MAISRGNSHSGHDLGMNVEPQSLRKSESNALASNLSRSKSSGNSKRAVSFNMGSLSPTGSHNAHSPSNPSNLNDVMITTTNLGKEFKCV
jgi:hypothetical protein